MVPLFSGEGSFGEQHFGNAQLGDRRRTRRLVRVADGMWKHPGGTLPEKVNAPADLKALYRLMDCDRVTHESVLDSHYERSRRWISESNETVLILHDTTELDFTYKHSLGGLGQIGNGSRRGYLCHNSLAVTASGREVIGLTSQLLHGRPVEKKRQTFAQRREAADRESRLWINGIRRSGRAPDGAKVVDVCDRGADTFELLDYEIRHGRTFVIRSARSRKLQEGGMLYDRVRRLPRLGERQHSIADSLSRSRRTATLAIAADRVTLLPPTEKRGEYRGVPLDLHVVRVWESTPAKNEAPLEWILLTNEPVEGFADACRVVDWYQVRPLIEEFHKAQKTGCRTEDMQFTDLCRLEPAIALMSVIALTLLALRDTSRRPDAKTRRATEILHPDYVEVLTLWRHKRAKMDYTVEKFYYALARLGGHQNRKRDKRPGWLILWKGWTRLNDMATGADIAKMKNKCG